MHSTSFKALYLLLTIASFLFIEAQARADLDKFFTRRQVRFWPDRSDRSGCLGHADDLRNSYREAAELIDAAVASIDAVKQPRPSIFKKRIDRWNWDRQARSMLSMFGVKIKTSGGPDESCHDEFVRIEQIFGRMKAGMDNDDVPEPVGPNGRRPGLACGTSGWEYKAGTDTDMIDSRLTVAERIAKQNAPNIDGGLWWFDGRYTALKGATRTDPGNCGRDVIASTLSTNVLGAITWCDLAWTSLTKTVDTISIKQYDILDVGPRKSMSHTWVHELAHFWGGYPDNGLPDEQKYNKDGKPVDGQVTYGIEAIMFLAKFAPAKASTTADAYAAFALAMYLPKWDWSKGWAEPFSGY